MSSWFNSSPGPDPRFTINDIRIVQLTHELPDGSTYHTFEVQRYYNCLGFGWHLDFCYDTHDDAHKRAMVLVKVYHPVKVVATVVREYKQ